MQHFCNIAVVQKENQLTIADYRLPIIDYRLLIIKGEDYGSWGLIVKQV